MGLGQIASAGRREKIRSPARISASIRVQPMSATIAATSRIEPWSADDPVEREHADERLDERLGDVEDRLDEVVARIGDEQEQDDAQDEQRLQDAERERHDA